MIGDLCKLGVTVFALFMCGLSFSAPTEPTYHCESKEGDTIAIFYSEPKALVLRSNGSKKITREWQPSEYLALKDLPNDSIRYVFSLPAKSEKVEFRNVFELREQFFAGFNPQELRMMLIQEGQILKGWKCYHHGTALVVRMLEDPSDSGRADLLLVAQAVKGFLTEEELTENALGMLLLVVERYSLWEKKLETVKLRQLIAKVFSPLGYLSPQMVKQLDFRLSESGKETWKLILSEIGYDKFAPIQRWIFWVNLGSGGNNEAVRAGIRGFVKSPLFQDANMKTFFKKETGDSIRTLSKESVKQILSGPNLSDKEKAFLGSLNKEKRP